MRIFAKSAFAMLATVALASVPQGCSDSTGEDTTTTGAGANDTTTGSAGGTASGGGDAGGATGTGGSGGTTTSTGGGLPDPTEEAFCQNKLYQCGDLIDNDGDGLIDYQDPDCLGPCDNTEDSFFPDLPGDSGQHCPLDCFWDTGQGNDEGCYWNHTCDPYANDQDPLYTGVANPQSTCTFSGTPTEQQNMQPLNNPPKTCQEWLTDQSQECLDNCGPLVPNGCDCFGCCELGGQYVWIGSIEEKQGTCDVSSIGEPDFLDDCHPCTPVAGCNNPCGKCELCIGKTELPPECYDGEGGGGMGGSGGAPQECDDGVQPCGLPGQDPCQSGYYCITGCCAQIPQ